jgi:hypothetical protein
MAPRLSKKSKRRSVKTTTRKQKVGRIKNKRADKRSAPSIREGNRYLKKMSRRKVFNNTASDRLSTMTYKNRQDRRQRALDAMFDRQI